MGGGAAPAVTCGSERISTRFFGGMIAMWVTRWRYEIATKPVRKGIWRLRQGGFLLRTRATDPRSGKEISLMRSPHDDRRASPRAVKLLRASG